MLCVYTLPLLQGDGLRQDNDRMMELYCQSDGLFPSVYQFYVSAWDLLGQNRFPPPEKNERVLSIEMGRARTVPFPTRTKHPVLTRPTLSPFFRYLQNPFSAPQILEPRIRQATRQPRLRTRSTSTPTLPRLCASRRRCLRSARARQMRKRRRQCRRSGCIPGTATTGLINSCYPMATKGCTGRRATQRERLVLCYGATSRPTRQRRSSERGGRAPLRG